MGARLVSRDYALYLKDKLDSFNAQPDISRPGLASLFNEITEAKDQYLKQLPDESGEDASRPRGLTTARLRQESHRLSPEALLKFTHDIVSMSLDQYGHWYRETGESSEWITEHIDSLRGFVVESLNEVRQEILEGNSPEEVRASYDDAIKKCLTFLTEDILRMIPEVK